MNASHSLIPPIAERSFFIYNHSRDGIYPSVTADRMKKVRVSI